VRVTPDVCTHCRLCEDACPYGAMRQPTPAPGAASGFAAGLAGDRRRLGWLVVALPILMVAGAWLGSMGSVSASRVHPTVALAEGYLQNEETPIHAEPQTAPALALKRAQQNPGQVLADASALQRRFHAAGGWFGAFVGLVLGVKLLGLSLRQRRTDYEPERGACFACARCFAYCPNERVRRDIRAIRDSNDITDVRERCGA
ncbi:MAG TPA: 4Fe-4S binding protein, partial [Verrucomicrobiae bacterium]|nr:4Fe-4S binding protein [Verrucomicrobiae bacterium]